MTDNIALSDQFFTATATADRSLLAEIYDPIFQGKQNDSPPMSADQLADYSALVLHLVNDIRYENVIRASTDTGFVEEYDLCCRFEDQTELRLRVCVVTDMVISTLSLIHI